MAPQTLQAPSTAEKKESAQAEAIWQSTEKLVGGLLKEAKDDQTEAGETPTPKSCLEAAYSMHVADMEAAKEIDPATGESEIEGWPTGIATANNLSLVILQTPFAAAAQHKVNQAKVEGKPKPPAAKATLRQFNQNLTAAMAFMPPDMLGSLPTTLPEQSRDLLDKWQLPTLTDKDYQFTLSGISREVAVWRKINTDPEKIYTVRGATTAEDARGADIIISDKANNELRMDVKTRNSFNEAVQRNLDAGDLTRQGADEAREKGFFYKRGKTPEGERVYNCVFDADMFGPIENFEYEKDQNSLLEFIDEQFAAERGKRLRNLGKSAIIS